MIKYKKKQLSVSILPTGANMIFLYSISMYKIADVLQYMFTYQNKSELEIGAWLKIHKKNNSKLPS